MADREPPKFDTFTDRQVAESALSMARSVRDGSVIKETESDLGRMLNVAIPSMAARAGIELTAAESKVVSDWEKAGQGPMTPDQARSSIRHGSHTGREYFGSGHPLFYEKGGIVPELVDRVERSEAAARPVDRERDIVLLAGLPDRAMAAKTLEHARELRQGAAITERDGAVGDLLNRVVPVLAHKLGVPIDAHEERVIVEHGRKQGQSANPEEPIEAMAQTILFGSRDGRKMFPDSPLFSKPENGNLAAVMLDRMLRQEGISQATRPDGSTEPYLGPDNTTRGVSGVVGPQAVGAHPLARHMLEKTAEMGHYPVPYWSPGHMLPPRDGGLFKNMLSPESFLEISAKQVYAERISRLPDAELAAELVEQSREMRERRPELAYEEHGYHRYMVWHGVPEMGTLFGQTMQDKERNPHPLKLDNDQQAFDSMSSAVLHGIGEGQMYVLRNAQRADYHEPPSLSEKVMFNEATSGSSLGMLLDRVAVELDVERGGELDRMGRAIAEVAQRRDPRVGHEAYAWTPKIDDEVSLRREPAVSRETPAETREATPAERKPGVSAMAAAFAAAGMGRG